MNMKIIFGSLLAVFLLLMLPAVSSVEYDTTVKANEEYIIDYIRKMDAEELKEQIFNMDISDQELLEFIKDNVANPTHHKPMHKIFHLIKKFLRLLIKILLLPLKIILLPLKIILIPFKILCKIICLPLKIMCCILHKILPDKHCFPKKCC